MKTANDPAPGPGTGTGWYRFGNLDSFLGFLNGLDLSPVQVEEIRNSTALARDGSWYWRFPAGVVFAPAEDGLGLFLGKRAGSPPAGGAPKKVAGLLAGVRPVRAEGPEAALEARNAVLYSAMHDVFDKMVSTIPAAMPTGPGSYEAEKLARLEELVKSAASGLAGRLFSQYLLLVPKSDPRRELDYLFDLDMRHVQACQVCLRGGTPDREVFWLLTFMGKTGQPPIAPKGSVLYYFIGGDGAREVYLECGWRYPRGWWRWLAARNRGLRLVSGGGKPQGRDFDIGAASLEFFPVSRFFRPDPSGSPEFAPREASVLDVCAGPESGIRVSLELRPMPETGKRSLDRKSLRLNCMSREIRLLEHRLSWRRLEMRDIDRRLSFLKREAGLLKGGLDQGRALAGIVAGRESEPLAPLLISLHQGGQDSLIELVRDCSKRFMENTGYCRARVPGDSGGGGVCHILTPAWLISGKGPERSGGGPGDGSSSTGIDNYCAAGSGGRIFQAEPYWKSKGALVFLPEGFALHPPLVFGALDPAEACGVMGPFLCGGRGLSDKSAWKDDEWAGYVRSRIFVMIPATGGAPVVLTIRRDSIVSLYESLRAWTQDDGIVRCPNCGHPG